MEPEGSGMSETTWRLVPVVQETPE